ncbi:putative efflux protein, MATE family [Ruminococcaceae bacterium YRB3002]|nr:putative efflux protein, MATE family [Ruminococcaceae bacterium YRB3002]
MSGTGEYRLDKKEFRSRLIRIVIPITMQNFMFALLPVSDTIMLGIVGQNDMSAISLAGQFFFLFNLFLSAVVQGTSLYAAQLWGDGDRNSIEKLFAIVLLLTMPINLIFFGIAMFAPGLVMQMYTNDAALIEIGVGYLRIVAFSYLFDGLTQLFQIIMKNSEMVKSTTVISGIMVFLNIILNATFIYGLFGIEPMGADGAALGTSLSCVVALTLTLFWWCRKCVIRLRMKYIIHPSGKILKTFFRYALPIFANSMSWGLGFNTITVIIGHMGSDVVAANAVVAVVKDLISSFGWALSAGGSILVGNELGAGNLDKAREYGARLCKISIISGLLAGLLAVAMIPGVLSIVDLTETAAHYLTWMMVMCIYYIMGRSINTMTIGGIFSAGGDTTFGMWCDGITMWCFIVPLGALAAFVLNWPVLLVYFILNLDEIIKLPAVYLHYKKYKWVRKIV